MLSKKEILGFKTYLDTFH